MTHKFDISQKYKLDNPERRQIMPPEKTLHDLGLTAGKIVADIGCGIGYFTIPAAAIVGPSGKIYALDISAEMLAEVQSEKVQQGIENIEVVRVAEYDLKLATNSVTFAFICNVLHETEDLDRYIDEIQRILTDKGKLVIIEWQKKVSSSGPPIGHRIEKTELVEVLKRHGFMIDENRSLGEDYYTITAEKKSKEV
jgi:ubiquinone/menaquinone biosynthesis C-methylase UbiE